MRLTRRCLLATTTALIVGGTAGCITRDRSGRGDGTLSVWIANRRETAQTVSVTVTDADGTVRTQITDRVLGSGVTETFDSSGYEDGRYTVRVDGTEGVTSGNWDSSDCPDHLFRTVLEDTDRRPIVAVETACGAVNN